MTGTTDKQVAHAWDGDPKTWRTYRKRALQYQEGTKYSERYLCGPRLEMRLTGRAETAVERCRPGWLSTSEGVSKLLHVLERRCGKIAVPDVGKELEQFLVKTRRRKAEPMQQWTDRFEVGYQYLRKALARAVDGGTETGGSIRSSFGTRAGSNTTWTTPVYLRPWRWVPPAEGDEWTWERVEEEVPDGLVSHNGSGLGGSTSEVMVDEYE